MTRHNPATFDEPDIFPAGPFKLLARLRRVPTAAYFFCARCAPMQRPLLWNVSATRHDSSRLAIFYSNKSEYFSFFYPAQSTHTYRNKARLRLPYENIVVFRSKTLFGSEDLNSFARSTPSLRTLMKSQARPTALVCHDQLTCKNDK